MAATFFLHDSQSSTLFFKSSNVSGSNMVTISTLSRCRSTVRFNGDIVRISGGDICEMGTLGARGLHAAHPGGRPKAGKTSGLHEANEVLVASDLWFQPSI